jgi:hypothetical protein
MPYIAVGSLAFSGYGDAPMKFHSPAGVDLGVPASNPKISPGSSGCGGLVTLADGTFCATFVDSGSPDLFTTYTLDNQLAGIVGGTTGVGPLSIASNYVDHYYGYLSFFVGNYSLKKFDAAGALVTSFDLGFNFFPSSGPIGVAPDESAAYYSKRSTASDPVRKCDLSGGFATFATETGFSLFDNAILVLTNGDVLVGWKKGATNGYVKHYDSSGSLLHTYSLSGTTPAPICLTPGLTSASFWVGYYNSALATSSGVTIAEIELGTGTVLNTFDPDDGAGFEYDGPFCVVRVAIGAVLPPDYEDPCQIKSPIFIAQLEDVSGNVTQAATRSMRNRLEYLGGLTAAPSPKPPTDLPEVSVPPHAGNFEVFGLALPFDTVADATLHAGARLVFRPGCFADAITRAAARLTLNHNDVLASQRDGTLHCWEDARGLWFAADLLDSDTGKIVRGAIITGMMTDVCVHVIDADVVERGLDHEYLTVHQFDVALLMPSAYWGTGVHLQPSFPGTFVRVNPRCEAMTRS